MLSFVYVSENAVSKHVDFKVGRWLLLYHTPAWAT